jgi:hypothetical protein
VAFLASLHLGFLRLHPFVNQHTCLTPSADALLGSQYVLTLCSLLQCSIDDDASIRRFAHIKMERCFPFLFHNHDTFVCSTAGFLLLDSWPSLVLQLYLLPVSTHDADACGRARQTRHGKVNCVCTEAGCYLWRHQRPDTTFIAHRRPGTDNRMKCLYMLKRQVSVLCSMSKPAHQQSAWTENEIPPRTKPPPFFT